MNIFVYINIFIYINQLNYSFYNISYYYQIISLLNTKNNLSMLIVFCVLIKYNYVNFYKNSKQLSFLYFIVFMLFLTFTNGIDCSTLLYDFFKKTNNNLNTNLLNGVMLIHPGILYTFYVFFINDTFLNFFKKSNQETKKFYYRSTHLILSSIILGS